MLRVFRRYLKKRIDDPGAHPFYQEWGQHDQVFCAATRQFSTASLPSLASIRFVLQGRYIHHTGNTPFLLRNGDCLVSGAGRTYAVEIDSPVPVKTLEVHYSHSTASDLAMDPADNCLNDLLDPVDHPLPDIIDRIEQPNIECSRLIRKLVKTTINPSYLTIESARIQLDQLLLNVLHRQKGFQQEWERLSAAHFSTRKELYRRLVRARDYLLSHYNKKITVDEVARIACLSRFHFQRLFREAFGITVYRMLVMQRLERAKSRLKAGETVASVSRKSGFAHESSFSRAYKRHFGCTPAQTR